MNKIMRNFKIEDFEGSGQYLVRMSPSEIYQRKEGKSVDMIQTTFLSTVMKKVGWLTNSFNIGNGENLTTLIDMSDGMVTYFNYINKNPCEINNWEKTIWQPDNSEDRFGGKRKLVDYLNNSELSQEHRFATHEEVMRVILSQGYKCK